MNEELNKKLAEWAGITSWKSRGGMWLYPDGDYHNCLPNFTKSLDACYKWLVPKAQHKGIIVHLIGYEQKGFVADCYDIVHNIRYDEVENDNPALALCLAIEKLIDKGG